MSGRCVVLSPPGTQRDSTRGIPSQHPRTHTRRPASESLQRGVEASREVCCVALARVLLLTLLLVQQSVEVSSSSTTRTPPAATPPGKPQRTLTKLHGIRWQLSPPVMLVTQAPYLKYASAPSLASSLIDMSDTSSFSSVKRDDLHWSGGLSQESSPLLKKRVHRLLRQMVRTRVGQKRPNSLSEASYRSSHGKSDGECCLASRLLREYDLSADGDVQDQSSNSVEDHPHKGTEDHGLNRLEDHSLKRAGDHSLMRAGDQPLNSVPDGHTHGETAGNNGSSAPEGAAPTALNPGDTSGVVKWDSQGSQERPQDTNWGSPGSEEAGRPGVKTAWPSLVIARPPDHNTGGVQNPLDPGQTSDPTKEIVPIKAGVIDSASLDHLLVEGDEATARYVETPSPPCSFSAEVVSPKDETQAEAPPPSGIPLPEGNDAGDTFRISLSSPGKEIDTRLRVQGVLDPQPEFQVVQMEISQQSGERRLVDDDSDDDNDWESRSEEEDGRRRRQEEEEEEEDERAEDRERTSATHTTLLYRRKRKIEVLEVSVVEGGLATLPCDLDVSNTKDSVQLILWIKEGVHTPLYSYDYRELLAGRPKETKPDVNSTLARRTSFRTDTSPAALLIDRVDADDAGVYRCRVDFLLTPTRNMRVNLTVIVPPSRARVWWRLANSGVMAVKNNIVGPFLESAAPSLICSNDDGWPPPAVVWYEGPDVLDDTYSLEGVKTTEETYSLEGVKTTEDSYSLEGSAKTAVETYSLEGSGRATVQNELLLGPLTRADLGRRLTCLAANTNKTQPATTTVTLAMTLSIVGVRVEEVASVWAGERAEVLCRVWGSRPPPTVVWWLSSVMLPPTQTKVVDDGNVTVSVLHFTPSPQDDGAMLICQATNEKLPDQAVQDSRLLSVNYAPLVEVRLGRSLDPLRIKEGDDVYFECSVQAKPSSVQVAWKHNGVELVAGAGVFLSNMSLVVQRVTRAHGGDYTCEATNIKATSSSPPLHLDVKYAPVCSRQERMQHSVAKLENAEISCKVRANPANVTFRWTFNNTAEAIDVPEGRFVVVGTESRVNYTPMNDLDYGTLLCWANNTIGMQEHPCVFHIVAAGKPDPPHNCRVFDVTISSLQVTCLPGDDGGLTQTFLLQVYQIGSTSPLIEVTRATPTFSVANLRPATAYKIIVAAVNHKGASTVTERKAYTARVSEVQEETSAEPTRDREREGSLPLAVLVGSGLTSVPLVVAAVVLLWLRVCRRTTAAAAAAGGTAGAGCGRRLSCHSKEEGSTGLPSEASPPDDVDPDLICHAPDLSERLDRCSEIATIATTATYFLHNGGPSFSVAATAAAAAATPAAAAISAAPATAAATTTIVVGGGDYTQLVCPETVHSHAHTSSHAHAHTPAAAASHVPYFLDPEQKQVVEVGVAPVVYFKDTFPEGDYQGGSSSGCYSALDRKNRSTGANRAYTHTEDYPQQAGSHRGYTHTEDYPQQAGSHRGYTHNDDYQQNDSNDPSLHNPFPHLYQTPGGSFSHTPHGSQYNLAQYQGNLSQGAHPVVGSPTPSLQGTLRRGSKKGALKGSLSPATHPHHHCEVHHPPKTPLVPETSRGEATLKRERRREPREGVDHSEAPTPNTTRKAKRESAV
ncbi:uncharacterized protein [Cherax quadricarinatus]|uniref:uncharacterized protein n=1 Tax=Cherax quadricarinatus TaxID=27406 RepID=UPI00387E47E6